MYAIRSYYERRAAAGVESSVEAGCSYIWNFVDGVTRPDLKYGDQLIVSAPNGNKKVYKITPDAYFPSHEAMLKTVVFPGVNA